MGLVPCLAGNCRQVYLRVSGKQEYCCALPCQTWQGNCPALIRLVLSSFLLDHHPSHSQLPPPSVLSLLIYHELFYVRVTHALGSASSSSLSLAVLDDITSCSTFLSSPNSLPGSAPSLRRQAPEMMHFQELAAFLRGDLATSGGELSIKLYTLAAKVGTAADPIIALAHDAALLSSIYRNLAEVMVRTSAFNTTIFSQKALDEIERSATARSITFQRLERNVEEASKLTRGRLTSSADGNKLSEDKQLSFDLEKLHSSNTRIEFAETKNFMLLIYHLGNLASDTKPKWGFSFKSSSFNVFNGQPSDMASDLLRGPKRQAMFDSILALRASKDCTSEPPYSPAQSLTRPFFAQPSSPTVSLDEDFEIIDTPSTRPGSPVILERDVAEPTFTCALPDRSLPISIKSTGSKRRLSIDASDEPNSDTKSRPTSKDGAVNAMDPAASHSMVVSKSTDENERIHALGNDKNEEWTLLEQQENKRPSETGLNQDSMDCVQGSEATQPMRSEQMDKLQACNHFQGDEAPVSQDNPISGDEDVLKLPFNTNTRGEEANQKPLQLMHKQAYGGTLMVERHQDVTPPPPPRRTNLSLQEFHQQLMLLEQQNKKRLLCPMPEKNAHSTAPPPPLPSRGNHALQDYQMQLMLLEQQNKKRLLMATQEQNAPSTAPTPPSGGNHALQDYQMQLMLLEQQNKKRLLMARQEQDAARTPTSPPPPVPSGGNHALQDRQTQLLLLEQESRKRLLLAQQEQDAGCMLLPPPPPPAGANHAFQDFQMQMMLLEQTNKQKLLMARQEQDRVQSNGGPAAYTRQPSDLGTQKIPVTQPDMSSLTPGPVTPDMLEQARRVLLQHNIKFSALSSVQRNSLAAQTLVIQENLARTWAQEPTLVYSPAEQELIKHSIDPENFSAAQLAMFTAQRPDMKIKAVQVFAQNQGRKNQVYAQNLLALARNQGKEIAFEARVQNPMPNQAQEVHTQNAARNQEKRIQACSQNLNWNSNQQQLLKQDADSSEDVELERPVKNEVGPTQNENTQRPQLPSPALPTCAGRQSQSQNINERSTEILRKHGLKSETLTADQVNLLQSATGEQLGRFVKACVETSHGDQPPSAAPFAYLGRQEQQTRYLGTYCPSEQQRNMQVGCQLQQVPQEHTKEAQIPAMGAPGLQPLTQASNAAISAHFSPQEQQTRHSSSRSPCAVSCPWCPSEQQRQMGESSLPHQVAHGHEPEARIPHKGAPGFQTLAQEKTSELLRERHTYGKEFRGFHTGEQQNHDGIMGQPRSMAGSQPELLADLAKKQDIQIAQRLAHVRAEEARRQREVRLNEKIAERAKELLKVDQAKAAEQQKQGEQAKMQQRLAGEYGEQAQKIALEQQKVRERMHKAYQETLKKQKEHLDEQLAKQPRPERPCALLTPMQMHRIRQQRYGANALTEQAWRKFEEGNKMQAKTPTETKKEKDEVEKSKDAKKMPVMSPQPAKKATEEDEVKGSEKVNEQPLDEEQMARLKIVEGLLREYTTLYT